MKNLIEDINNKNPLVEESSHNVTINTVVDSESTARNIYQNRITSSDVVSCLESKQSIMVDNSLTERVNPFTGFITKIDKLAVFIDGANFHAACRRQDLMIDVDFSLLRDYLKACARLVTINYYTALTPRDEQSSIHRLTDWLSYNGFKVIKKPIKEFNNNGERKIKGNMDVEITTDMIEAINYVDHMFLFSGDGDFSYVVSKIQQKGIVVTVISTYPYCADELKRTTSSYIDIENIKDSIKRTVRPKNKEVTNKGHEKGRLDNINTIML